MRDMVAGAADEAPASLRDAITEAVEGSDYVTALESGEFEPDPFEGMERDPEADPEAAGDELASGDGTEPSAESGAVEEDGTDYEAMTDYWGTSLEGFSVEQKKAVISALEQRDSTIQTLQRRLAQEPKAPEPVADAAAEEEVELTDDDILRALGIDPENADPFEVQTARRVSVPLARQLMAVEEQVEQIAKTEEVRAVANNWNMTLDQLEGQYGKLPGNRQGVLQYAIDEKIGDPEVLYFRLTAGPRKAVEQEVAKVRQEAAKKAAQGGLRPQSRTAGKKILDTKGMSLKETVKAAAREAQQETGYKWGEVVRRG